MLKVREFKHSDVLGIKVPYKLSGEQRVELAKGATDALTIIDGDNIIAVGGASVMWPGVAEFWMLASTDATKKPVAFARCTKKIFNDIIKRNNIARAQATVNSGDKTALSYAEWLGMESEGLMRKYGPEGNDYYRVARIS